MKIGAIPENLIERIAKWVGVVPTPLLETFQGISAARTLMVATKLGVFEALADKPISAEETARRLGTHPRGTAILLDALVSGDYLCFKGGCYSLSRVARKWLLRSSPKSLHDNMLWRFMEWEIVEQYEDFVRDGKPLDVHAGFSDEQWGAYQRAMRSLAGLSAEEVARRVPVPRHAREMLDIGGSHGYYSVAICRRHPALRSTILDLPDAVRHSAPILAAEGMGDRVVHRPGNALTDDLGEAQYDLIYVANLIHHFDAPTNAELARRAARALRPGGFYVNLELIRPHSPTAAGQTGAMLNLFFAVTSRSGTWSFEEMAGWQRDAGLDPRRPIRLATLPGAGMQAGRKAAGGPPRSGGRQT